MLLLCDLVENMLFFGDPSKSRTWVIRTTDGRILWMGKAEDMWDWVRKQDDWLVVEMRIYQDDDSELDLCDRGKIITVC